MSDITFEPPLPEALDHRAHPSAVYPQKVVLVSCAGPDDANAPSDIAALANQTPHMEIGLQLSHKHVGAREYPTHAWIRSYAAAITTGRSSLHVNGAWSRAIAQGQMPDPVQDLCTLRTPTGQAVFGRIQLNFHAKDDHIELHALVQAITALQAGPNPLRVVLQHHRANATLVEAVRTHVDVDVLFDGSLGFGVVPDVWPVPLPGGFCAFAGGLRPETVLHHLDQIAVGSIAAARGAPLVPVSIGVDAQRGLRDAQGAVFVPERAAQFARTSLHWTPPT